HDASNNASSKSFKVTVQDTTGPVFSNVPADVTVTASGPGGAVVTYAGPTAMDAVDGTRTVTCAPPSGSTFPVGMTTVTCSASDTRGNGSQAMFRVTVNAPVDMTPPVITVPADVTREATGPTGAVVTYTATATDDTDPAPVLMCT